MRKKQKRVKMGSGSSRPGTAPPSYLTPDDNIDSGEVRLYIFILVIKLQVVTAAEIRRENNGENRIFIMTGACVCLCVWRASLVDGPD